MTNEEQVRILEQGVKAWDQWREENHEIEPDLFQADLSWVDLSEANLRNADLRGAKLSGADLSGANLDGAIGTRLFQAKSE